MGFGSVAPGRLWHVAFEHAAADHAAVHVPTRVHSDPFGTGMVGQAIAGRLHELGHTVVIGTRDPEATLARTEPDGIGNPPFSAWRAAHEGVAVATFADAAASAELVVNASSGAASLDLLGLAGAENLAGKVLLDIANPLDFSPGRPPALTVCNTDSLGEQVQRAFPAARVVKALNTVNCNVMVDPGLLPGDHHLFLCGNDAAAKARVADLLVGMGWKRRNLVDLGDITAARATEMFLPLWLRLSGVLGTPHFSFRVVAP